MQKESDIDVIKKSLSLSLPPLCVLIVEAGRDNPSSFPRTYRPPSCIRISNNIAIAERHRWKREGGDILHAAATAIDAFGPLTAGHSCRHGQRSDGRTDGVRKGV